MREERISNPMKKTHSFFPLIIIFLGLIVISMPLQNAYGAITGVTIDNIAINNVIGAEFQLDYTITNDNVAPLNAADGVVTFARTGGTGDPQATHTYTMIAGDLTGAVGGQAHTLTRATLEGDAGFDVLVDGTIYTVTVSLNAGAVTATVTGVTVDLTAPTFTATLGPADTQINITWSENVDSFLDSATPWTVSGGFTVTATTPLNGLGNTQTLTLGQSVPDGSTLSVTYTAGGNGDIEDTADVSPNAAATATIAGVTADFTAPTFTAAFGPENNQITITWSENVDSFLDSATPWSISNGIAVTATTPLNGLGNTQTLTLASDIGAGTSPTVTYTAGGNGDIEDTADVPNVAATATVALTGVPAAISGQGSGCSGDCEAPTLGMDSEYNRKVTDGFSYNGVPTDVERFYTPYPLITVNVGEANKAVFKIYENYGPQNVKHFSLAFGLGSDQIISLSKAMIELDIDFDGTETVTITDPENALENVTVKTSTGDCNGDSVIECLIVTIDHTFRAPLEFNIVGTDVWDMRRNSWQNYYNHGIEVVGESLNPPNEYFGIYKGKLIHLIETAKNTAIDAEGNTWTFDKTWIMDYIPKGKIDDPTPLHGFDRNHVKFDTYKQGQELIALSLLEQICLQCFDKPFEEINDIFSYEFPEESERLNAEVQKIMLEQSKIAQQKMESIYP